MIDNREHRFISAVVYVHNNEDLIECFLKTLYDSLSKNFQKFEIICVNDASRDASLEVIKETAKNFDDTVISIVNMGFHQGLELCMNAGEDLAIGDFVYEFDTVFMDYDPDYIAKIYHKSMEGFDLVSACPDIKPKKTSSIFYRIFNRFSNTTYKLQTESFRIVSRRAINRVFSMKYQVTDKNKSKQFTNERRTLAFDSLILFTDVGYRFSMIMSFFMIFAVAIIGIYTVVIYLSSKPVEGWTPIMLFLAIGFFGLFVVLTLALKYLSLIFNLVFKKQRYIIEGIEKVKK